MAASGTASEAVVSGLRFVRASRTDSLWLEAWRRFRRHRLAMLGAAVLAVMVAAVIGPPSP